MKCLIIVFLCFIAGVTSDNPPGFPAQLQIDRDWYVKPTDPIGTFVARASQAPSGDKPVTYGLEAANPPVPFTIDPSTGVVTVSDKLDDKESKSYSLWVTSDDGSIPQKTEVFASVTDKDGNRVPPHP